jgi:hypothetical protein
VKSFLYLVGEPSVWMDRGLSNTFLKLKTRNLWISLTSENITNVISKNRAVRFSSTLIIMSDGSRDGRKTMHHYTSKTLFINFRNHPISNTIYYVRRSVAKETSNIISSKLRSDRLWLFSEKLPVFSRRTICLNG